MANDVVISVKQISKCYRVFEDERARLCHLLWPGYQKRVQAVWALTEIDFEIKRGESVAIIGRNGGGKSTLLEILTGTLRPTSGIVEVNGRVSALLELGSGFNPAYSGRDNVILNGLLLGLSRSEILSRFDEIAAFAEIGDAMDRPVKTYSSGMMMRLAFAVQVLCDPDILIIDEALSVGDFFFQQKCLSYIRQLVNKGVTLLFVSHDMGTVRDLCQRVLYLRRGKLLFDGAVSRGVAAFLNEQTQAAVVPDLPRLSTDREQVSQVLEQLRQEAIYANEASQQSGCIVAVCLYNRFAEATNSFQLGEEMRVRVGFLPAVAQDNHITVAILDKYGAVRTATGSFQQNLAPIRPNLEKGIVFFELQLTLLLEAGQYSLSVTQGCEVGQNRGCIFDEVNQLGPIQVVWDYERERAPFLGQVGLPSSAQFIEL